MKSIPLVLSLSALVLLTGATKPKKEVIPPFMTAVSDAEQEAIVAEYTKDLKGWTEAERRLSQAAGLEIRS